jgi:enoyl-CoA hydratase/carnithine racemase
MAIRRFTTPSRLLHKRMSSGLVSSRTLDKVTIITLNDPARLNPLTFEMGNALLAECESLDFSKTNAVVITGAGRAFSAGGDLDFLNQRSRDTGSRNSVIMRRFYSAFLGIRNLPVPVLAAINGPAIGAGLCFAVAADMRIAAQVCDIGDLSAQ